MAHIIDLGVFTALESKENIAPETIKEKTITTLFQERCPEVVIPIDSPTLGSLAVSIDDSLPQIRREIPPPVMNGKFLAAT